MRTGFTETVPAVTDTPAPTNPAELHARLHQLHTYYTPYLRSLPRPLDVRTRADLSGTWRCKYEVEDFPEGPKPPAPDWYRVDLDDSAWQHTTVPEWRYDTSEPFGTKPDPSARRPDSHILWYRTTFASEAPSADQRVFLNFAGVFWEAEVWLNGTFLGSHTAYWEPFRFDVTALMTAQNVLAVRVLSGPNLGQPIGGWSVLPFALAEQPRYVRDASQSVVGQRELFGFRGSCLDSGIGIHREVLLETTGTAVVSAIFARADLRTGEANIKIDLDSADQREVTLAVQVLPENFQGRSYQAAATRRLPPGKDSCTVAIPMPDARRWQPTDPCLYRCRVTVREGKRITDAKDVLFGCRSFRLLTAEDQRPDLPEGMLMLNDQPIYLRCAGASSALNAFWYWHQDDKLLDAILMMKAANFNAVRANEHIQFPEVRELLDRLGMPSEQDNCAHSRPAGLAPMDMLADEGARLARECYNNPGVILLETGYELHYDPTRLVEAILAVDPERIVKPISGNMLDWGYWLPPGYPTMPKELWDHVLDDFHTYRGWYRRGADLAMLTTRYPAGRIVTVGEFGAEALDNYSTMQRYPACLHPPPLTADTLWGNAQVKIGDPKMLVGFRGQTPRNLGQYIEASQNWQADALGVQATGFRLSPRRIGGYFVFHFIDGLPAMWPKAIVGFDLGPKKAYFAMAQVNQPVVPLFQLVDAGHTLDVWVANDLTDALPGSTVVWAIEADGTTLLQGERHVDVRPLDATPVATVDLSPFLRQNPVMTIALALSDADGKRISCYRHEVYLPAWNPPRYAVEDPAKVLIPKLPAATAGGDPTKVDWTHATSLAGWRQVTGAPTQHQIEARIAHDGRYLYVTLSEAVVAEELQVDDGIWSGENWELFFAKQRGEPYRQFGVNPKGVSLELPFSDTALPPCGVTVVSELAKDRWTVQLAFPLDTLVPGGLQSGSVFYGNFNRSAGSGVHYREYLAWSPNYAESFHAPERLGELTLQ